jgi:hypothetical protein
MANDGLVTPELVMAHHPAAGTTLRPAAVRAAYELMEPGEFARAWGNRWTTVPEYAIDQVRWRAAGDSTVELPEPGTVALAFDVALDGADATIAAAWRLPAGRVHVEIVAYERGSLWLPDRMAAAIDRWAPRLAVGYDTRGPATEAADKLARGGVELLPLSTVDLTAASPAALAALTADPPLLTYTPHPALDAAAAAAARRKVGDLWVWGRHASAGSISPLVALTLAAWTLDHAPDEPPPSRFEIL